MTVAVVVDRQRAHLAVIGSERSGSSIADQPGDERRRLRGDRIRHTCRRAGVAGRGPAIRQIAVCGHHGISRQREPYR